ncbi:MAG: phosphoribosyl-AMP cyclohydrolase [Candidatus Omnitrophota bacterium]|nr:MAG: phosphoribosyl-AMP cyclohydrolase [Candidatus Omnitrophota bacterium]
MSLWDLIRFNADGLVTAIARDAKTGRVLMAAFMNREALEKTLATKTAHYYSRSRKKLWLKGESSGHVQQVLHLYIDCDGDAVLMDVEQEGAACHAGYFSCFYREITSLDEEPVIAEERIFNPEQVYKNS